MRKATLIALLLTSMNLLAKDCELTADRGNVNLDWIAFKTKNKIPVKARFKYLGIEKEIKGKGLEDFLTGISFDIDTTSTSTRNTARDANIVKYFFQKLVGGMSIKGKTLKLAIDKLKVAVTMNKVTKLVDLTVKQSGRKITAKGSIDVLDFKLNSALASINKACYDLHKGKTWSQVDLVLTIYTDNTCE
jgi:hypothetical protein